jgi:hypothetical protein
MNGIFVNILMAFYAIFVLNCCANFTIECHFLSQIPHFHPFWPANFLANIIFVEDNKLNCLTPPAEQRDGTMIERRGNGRKEACAKLRRQMGEMAQNAGKGQILRERRNILGIERNLNFGDREDLALKWRSILR